MLGIRKTNKWAVGWFQPLENQRYQMVLPPVGTTLLMMAIWEPRVPNAINTLSEQTHLSTTNSSNLCSSNIKVNLSKKKKKNQSQVTVDKKTKRQKDVFFKHCWSSHTLQRYKTQYNNTPLFWFFFLHSLLWFLGFSQMIVWWVSFHFFFLFFFFFVIV